MPTIHGDGADARRVPEPTLTVGAVARRLGVAASTLRTWDRRYGLGPSRHIAGAHRRYSAEDVARLVIMRRLTMDGVPPAEAARIAVTQAVAPEGPGQRYATVRPLSRRLPPPAVPGHDSVPGHDPVPGHDLVPGEGRPPVVPGGVRLPIVPTEDAGRWPPTARMWTGARLGGQGGGRVVALPEGSPAARGLARAAMALDTQEVTRLLREATRNEGVVSTWDLLVTPVLTALGQRWRATGEGIEVEHAFSEAVLGVLRGWSCSVHSPRNVRPVLLACPEGDQHVLPLFALAAALAEDRVGCRMLGAGMPSSCLLAAVRRSGPAVVFLHARMPVDDIEILRDIPRQRPVPRVMVGGRGWDPDLLPRCARLVSTLGEAVDEVTAAL